MFINNHGIDFINPRSDDESDKESDLNLELEDNVDTFFDWKVWDEIGKNLEDFTEEDMRKLEFNRHSNCIKFDKMEGFQAARTDTWHVTCYNGEHNHPLVPMNQVPFIRGIQEADKIRIKSLIDSRVRPSMVMRNLADNVGGLHKKIRFEEDQDDYIFTHTFPVIHSILGEIKTQAAQTYTSAVYEVFCKELANESGRIVTRSEEDLYHVDGPTSTYSLKNCLNKDSTYIVLYNKLEQIMCCCFAKLESIGIPCQHMFAVMKYEGMVEIPRGCNLRRRTIKAKAHLVDSNDKTDLHRNDERAAAGRFAFLSSLSNQLCRMASTSYD
ncbi:Protein FAR-RED IMPAIRED RESPONSE 1 [Bienertia sinuspersici]